MAQRTTRKLVEELLDTDRRQGRSVQPFIDIAANIVDAMVACATARGKSYDAGLLVVIETWLAAHYYTRRDPTYASRSTNGKSGSFHGQTGMGLDASFYGQSAKDADPVGCLAAVTAKKKPQVEWLGKPPSQQVDYADRN